MKNNKGFTLIELLVVIAIIGLLSTLAVISLNNARAKSRDSKRVADVKQIQTALELYYNDNNRYPTALTDADMTTYMAQVPYQPQPQDATIDANCGAITNNTTPYTYATQASDSSYTINFCLGAQTGGLAEGYKTATPAGIQ